MSMSDLLDPSKNHACLSIGQYDKPNMAMIYSTNSESVISQAVVNTDGSYSIITTHSLDPINTRHSVGLTRTEALAQLLSVDVDYIWSRDDIDNLVSSIHNVDILDKVYKIKNPDYIVGLGLVDREPESINIKSNLEVCLYISSILKDMEDAFIQCYHNHKIFLSSSTIRRLYETGN